MDLPRPEKILVAMNRLSNGTTQPLEYEDIVVRSWELFPEEFGLRKYVDKHPDSSDQHKPLYGPLKDRGYVLSGNKKFRLTEKGIAYCCELEAVLAGKLKFEKLAGGKSVPSDRISRDKEIQLKRLLDTDAFRLFAAGQQDGILDTDFYTYLGVTVRTERHEFLGRLQTVADAVADGVRLSSDPKIKLLEDLHQFLVGKFQFVVNRNKALK